MKKPKCLLRLLLLTVMLSMSTGSAWANSYLPGSWNEFAPTDENCEIDNTLLTMYLTAGTYSFKFYYTGINDEGTDWYGCNGTMTRDDCTRWHLTSKNGTNDYVTMVADSTGYYTFSIAWDEDEDHHYTGEPYLSIAYPKYRVKILSGYPTEGGDLHLSANYTSVGNDCLLPEEAYIELSPNPNTGYTFMRVRDINDIGRPVHFKLRENLTIWAEYAVTATGQPDGSGTKDDPYQIASLDHLKWLNTQVTDVSWNEDPVFYAKQVVDTLFLNESNFAGVGKSNRPFRGEYDGQGKTILLLSNRASDSHDYFGGVFSCIETCTIRDLNVIKSTSKDKDGVISETKVSYESSYAESYGVTHTDEAVGTVIGRAMGSSKIINVTSNVDLKVNGGGLGDNIPTSHMGGIVGMITGHTEVRGCTYTGNIDAGISKDCIGGIVGYADENSNTEISHCFAKGTIKTTSTEADHVYIGGILGYINDDGLSSQFEGVSNCFADVTFDLPSGHTYSKVAAIIGDPRGDDLRLNKITDNYYIDHQSFTLLPVGNSKHDNSGFDQSKNKAITCPHIAEGESDRGSITFTYTNPTYNETLPLLTRMVVTATGTDPYHFDYWTGLSTTYRKDGYDTSNPKSVALNGDVDLEAHFSTEFTIDENNVLVATGHWLEGEVTIPDGVLSIGKKAFYDSKVTRVTIPATVTTIAEQAFQHCTSLTDITFAPGSRCKSIGENAVYNNSSANTLLHLTSLPKMGSQYFLTVASLALTDDSYVSTVDAEFSDVTFPGKGTRTYTRQMTNEWGTAVLPFTVETNSEVQLYSIASISCPTDGNEEEGTEPAGTITLSAVSDTIQANRPFVFRKKNPNATSVTFTDSKNLRAFIPHNEKNSFTISEVGVKLVGTYVENNLEACQSEEGECTSTNYFIANNAFWRADDGVTIPPFRAWFDFSNYTGCGQGNTEEGEAPARFIIAESQTPTGLTPSDSPSRGEVEKVIIDGRMYILRGTTLYDLNGRLVK